MTFGHDLVIALRAQPSFFDVVTGRPDGHRGGHPSRYGPMSSLLVEA